MQRPKGLGKLYEVGGLLGVYSIAYEDIVEIREYIERLEQERDGLAAKVEVWKTMVLAYEEITRAGKSDGPEAA